MSEEKTPDTEIESNSEGADSEVSSPPARAPEATKGERKDKAAGSSFFSGLVGLLSISALAGVGIIGYFGYQQFLQMSDRLIILEQQQATAALNNNFEKLQVQLQQSLSQQQESNEEKINDFSDQLSATQRQLLSVGVRHRNDSLLA